MKTILKQTIGIFGISILAAFFITCSDIIQIQEQHDNSKASVFISVTDSTARTVLPQVSLSDIISYKLLGGISGAAETELAEFTAEGTCVSLETGIWNFTLNGYNNSGSHILQAKVLNKQIYLTGTNQVSFSLSTVNSGTGAIQISLNFPETAGITRISTSGDIGSEEYTPTSSGSFIYTKDNIAAGDKLINFSLYSGDYLQTVISELVLVRNNLTSSKTITITEEDLKPLVYTVTFNSNGGSNVPGQTVKSGETAAIPFPPPVKAGFTLAAWYSNPELSYLYNFSAPVTGNIILYAKWTKRTRENSVYKAEFSGATATVNIDNLSGNDIYLVKVNTSGLVVNAGNTGGAEAIYPDFENNRNNEQLYVPDDLILPRMGHPAADEFNAKAPPIIEEPRSRLQALFIPPDVGDTKMFWVEQYYNNNVWVEREATLRASGEHANIWVMNDNYMPGSTGTGNKITTAQAQALAAKFDIIYPAATNILGYEYGGGPGGDGGRDGDPKIQILVYDIVNSAGTVQAAGYFWSKDYYPQEQLLTQKTNLAEIFYIDASQVNTVPDYIYTTLAHEFQHMINFNQKQIKRGLASASWYNEMLSMMTEDVIADLIGIAPTNSRHEIRVRIPVFLRYYSEVGFTEWNTLDSYSYAKGFAFGAYLMRNYGGANLLGRILANNTANEASITAALNEISPGMDFQQALNRFGEAMIFSGPEMPEDVLTFDNTVTNTINGITYTAHGFNVWTTTRSGGGTGPYIFDLTQREMRPHSISIHQANEWKNKSGSFSITLNRPANSNVAFYLMVK